MQDIAEAPVLRQLTVRFEVESTTSLNLASVDASVAVERAVSSMVAPDLTSTGSNGKVNFEDHQGSPALPSVEDIMNMAASGAVDGPPVGSIPAAVFSGASMGQLAAARMPVEERKG